MAANAGGVFFRRRFPGMGGIGKSAEVRSRIISYPTVLRVWGVSVKVRSKKTPGMAANAGGVFFQRRFPGMGGIGAPPRTVFRVYTSNVYTFNVYGKKTACFAGTDKIFSAEEVWEGGSLIAR